MRGIAQPSGDKLHDSVLMCPHPAGYEGIRVDVDVDLKVAWAAEAPVLGLGHEWLVVVVGKQLMLSPRQGAFHSPLVNIDHAWDQFEAIPGAGAAVQGGAKHVSKRHLSYRRSACGDSGP